MKRRNIFEKAFTLVELLIVIALIAILSVAVLATINPIEQSNKARDAKFKNDAAEVLSSYERYYTSQTSYPWMDVTIPDTGIDSIDDTVIYASDEAPFGIVDDPDEAVSAFGLLINASELKTSFMGKEPFDADLVEEDRMYAYHDGDTNSNYVCFHPKAKANRVLVGGETELKCVTDGADGAGALIDYDGVVGGCEIQATWTTVPAATNANLLCVPEGDII